MMKNLTTAEFITIVISSFALLVSIFAILGSLYTYCVHDAKLKKQDAKLNKYQLEKIDEEKTRQKRADIKAEIVSKSGYLFIIRIENIGLCEAKDLMIEAEEREEEGIKIDPNPFQLEKLGTGEHNELKLFQINNTSPNFKVLNITWKDEYKSDNRRSIKLSLI